METSIFNRTEYLTSNVKSKLISTYVGKELAKSFQKSFEAELLQKSFNHEKNEDVSTVLSASFENTRPSSVNSSIRGRKLVENKQVSATGTKLASIVPLTYKNSLKVLQERINVFSESMRNENSDYLLFSFLLIYTGIWGNELENPVLSFVQANIWNSFREIIARDEFEKRIGNLPRMVSSRKVPQEELKKALSWFCMIRYDGLETLKELYEVIRETFIYARKFYFFSIVLPEYKNTSKTETRSKLHKTTQAAGKTLSKDRTHLNNSYDKIELEKTSNSKRLINRSTASKLSTDKKILSKWEKEFQTFWSKKTEKGKLVSYSKEKIFKEFKSISKLPLGTEISLLILNKISENLKNKHV